MSSVDTVLVIDNEPELQDLIRVLLADWGLNVASACDGQDAFSYLADHDLPSLILLDFKMPNMDGFQFRALQLRNDRS